VRATALTAARVERLKEILSAHPGDSPVFVHLVGAEKETVLQLGESFGCDGSNSMFAELRILFGADCIA
jgi:DNA polymerase-3 subunit alpha